MENLDNYHIEDFNKCILLSNERKCNKHLLMGNGFSIDLFHDRFSYSKLVEKINNDKVKETFKLFKTSDLELILEKLDDTIQLLQIYNIEDDTIKIFKEDFENLKFELIKIIKETQPFNSKEIMFVSDSCIDFLYNFNNGFKFTLNYDLLLYWVINSYNFKFKENQIYDLFRKKDIYEGKSILFWDNEINKEQDLYFLHGALHLFSNNLNRTYKVVTDNRTKNILELISDNINNNNFPLFITEGKSKDKLKRINENIYLYNSFKKLSSVEGDFYIFGHSLNENDNHILDKILENKNINNIFVSYHSNEENIHSEDFISKTSILTKWELKYNENPNRKYYLYNSKTAHVWDKYFIDDEDEFDSEYFENNFT